MSKFTVVIPVYNRENVIARAIRSVQAQSFEDWELIIVDDGSIDETGNIVKSFLSDQRVQYVWQKNGGAQVARNHGLKLAKGEYICFLDSDDELLPDFLAEMLSVYNTYPEIGCVYCWTGVQQQDGTVYLRKDTLEGDIYARALRQGYVTSPTFLTMKRKCFDVIGVWDESFQACQDDDICFRLAKHFRFRLIRRPLALYHAEYSGNENRIGASQQRVMDAWWQLWQKYENDVVAYCGELTMWRHFMKCYKDFCSQGGDEDSKNAAWLKVEAYAGKSVGRDVKSLFDMVNGHSVYCYGAGKYGRTVARCFLRSHIPVKAFVITDGQPETEGWAGIPVIHCSELPEDEEACILLAASEPHQFEMRRALGRRCMKAFDITADMESWLSACLERG